MPHHHRPGVGFRVVTSFLFPCALISSLNFWMMLLLGGSLFFLHEGSTAWAAGKARDGQSPCAANFVRSSAVPGGTTLAQEVMQYYRRGSGSRMVKMIKALRKMDLALPGFSVQFTDGAGSGVLGRIMLPLMAGAKKYWQVREDLYAKANYELLYQTWSETPTTWPVREHHFLPWTRGVEAFYRIIFQQPRAAAVPLIKDDQAIIPARSNLVALTEAYEEFLAFAKRGAYFNTWMTEFEATEFTLNLAPHRHVEWQIREVLANHGKLAGYTVNKVGVFGPDEDDKLHFGIWRFASFAQLNHWLSNDIAETLVKPIGQKSYSPAQVQELFTQYRQKVARQRVPSLLRPKNDLEIFYGRPGFDKTLSQYLDFVQEKITQAEGSLWDGAFRSLAHAAGTALDREDTPSAANGHSWVGDDRNFLFSLELLPRNGHPVYYFIRDHEDGQESDGFRISTLYGIPFKIEQLQHPRPSIGSSRSGWFSKEVDNFLLDMAQEAYLYGADNEEYDQRKAAWLPDLPRGTYQQQATYLRKAIEQYAKQAHLKLKDFKIENDEDAPAVKVLSFAFTLPGLRSRTSLMEIVKIKFGSVDYNGEMEREEFDEDERLISDGRRYDFSAPSDAYQVQRIIVDRDRKGHFANTPLELKPLKFQSFPQAVQYVEGILGGLVMAKHDLAL
jgi:hypothetical protein